MCSTLYTSDSDKVLWKSGNTFQEVFRLQTQKR